MNNLKRKFLVDELLVPVLQAVYLHPFKDDKELRDQVINGELDPGVNFRPLNSFGLGDQEQKTKIAKLITGTDGQKVFKTFAGDTNIDINVSSIIQSLKPTEVAEVTSYIIDHVIDFYSEYAAGRSFSGTDLYSTIASLHSDLDLKNLYYKNFAGPLAEKIETYVKQVRGVKELAYVNSQEIDEEGNVKEKLEIVDKAELNLSEQKLELPDEKLIQAVKEMYISMYGLSELRAEELAKQNAADFQLTSRVTSSGLEYVLIGQGDYYALDAQRLEQFGLSEVLSSDFKVEFAEAKPSEKTQAPKDQISSVVPSMGTGMDHVVDQGEQKPNDDTSVSESAKLENDGTLANQTNISTDELPRAKQADLSDLVPSMGTGMEHVVDQGDVSTGVLVGNKNNDKQVEEGREEEQNSVAIEDAVPAQDSGPLLESVLTKEQEHLVNLPKDSRIDEKNLERINRASKEAKLSLSQKNFEGKQDDDIDNIQAYVNLPNSGLDGFSEEQQAKPAMDPALMASLIENELEGEGVNRVNKTQTRAELNKAAQGNIKQNIDRAKASRGRITMQDLASGRAAQARGERKERRISETDPIKNLMQRDLAGGDTNAKNQANANTQGTGSEQSQGSQGSAIAAKAAKWALAGTLGATGLVTGGLLGGIL